MLFSKPCRGRKVTRSYFSSVTLPGGYSFKPHNIILWIFTRLLIRGSVHFPARNEVGAERHSAIDQCTAVPLSSISGSNLTPGEYSWGEEFVARSIHRKQPLDVLATQGQQIWQFSVTCCDASPIINSKCWAVKEDICTVQESLCIKWLLGVGRRVHRSEKHFDNSKSKRRGFL